MDAINRQRTTVGSHERIGVFRVFGRDAGYTALYTAYVTSIRCGIPEYKFDLEKMIDLLVADKKNNPSNYSLVILSEGAEWEGFTVQEYGEPDAFGHRKKMSVAESLQRELKRARTKRPSSAISPTICAAASPDFVDKLVANTFGTWRSTRSAGQERTDGRVQRRLLRDGRDPRSQARAAPRRSRDHVQHRALPPDYTNKARASRSS